MVGKYHQEYPLLHSFSRQKQFCCFYILKKYFLTFILQRVLYSNQLNFFDFYQFFSPDLEITPSLFILMVLPLQENLSFDSYGVSSEGQIGSSVKFLLLLLLLHLLTGEQSHRGGNNINIFHDAEKIGAGEYFKWNYNEIIVYGPASPFHPESVIQVIGPAGANMIEFREINKEGGWGLFAKKKTCSLLIRRIYRMLHLKIDDFDSSS